MKEFAVRNCSRTIFRNKCCIVCLILLFLLLCTVIGIKLFINSLLAEIEADSYNSTFSGEIYQFHNETNNSLEALINNFPRDIASEFPHTLSGHDYKNQPVWIIPYGKWDIRKFLTANEDNERRLKQYIEYGIQRAFASLKLKNSTKFVVIGDLDGFSYFQLASYKNIAFQLQMVLKYEPLFPMVDYGFAVNMDYLANMMLSIVEPLVESLLPRITMIGTDKKEYTEAILKRIPANQLPPDYGGSSDYKPIKIFN